MNPSRRPARVGALEVLYQVEVGAGLLSDALARVRETEIPEAQYIYCLQLVDGYWDRREDIDALIETYLRDWTMERLAIVDKNVLRLAAFELLHMPIPAAVTIDEAVEIARTYGSEESPRFINGVLGAILKDYPKGSFVEPELPAEEVERIEEEEVSPEQAEAVKMSFWKIRSEPKT